MEKLNQNLEVQKSTPWILNSCSTVRIDTQELYLFIRKQGNIRVMKRGNENGVVLYQYKDNRYQLLTDSDCKAYIKSQLPVKIRKPSDWERVYKELITDDTDISEKDLNSNQEIINFTNGILNIKTGELLPHSPNYLTTIQIPCNWNPELDLDDAPIFKNFIETLTSGNIDDQTTILEIIGLIISNVEGCHFKKLLFLKGVGDSGKTVLREFVIKLIGQENSHSMDIKQLNEKFSISEIYGKRLVGYGDLSFVNVPAIDKIKELTGGDSTRSEAKYQTGYQFRYKGFLWYNCNELPKFSGDHGNWVFERFIIISCDNSIPKEKQDRNLVDNLLKEKDAIASAAIKCFKKAYEKGCLTESKKVLENRKNYAIKNNSFEMFLQERCILHEGKIHRSTFNSIYKEWCQENNFVRAPMYQMKAILEKKGITAMKSSEYYYDLTIN